MKTPLMDYQYTLNFKNEGQDGKTNLFLGWGPVGGVGTRKGGMMVNMLGCVLYSCVNIE
jgi:hypothetical protein